jgi:hypothetical protein
MAGCEYRQLAILDDLQDSFAGSSGIFWGLLIG